jgi:uncharacterized protein YceK
MKNSIVLILAVSTVLLAGCCTSRHHEQATKWEYKVEDYTHWKFDTGGGPKAWTANVQDHLNQLGKDGWILVTTLGEGQRVFYFKRPVK